MNHTQLILSERKLIPIALYKARFSSLTKVPCRYTRNGVEAEEDRMKMRYPKTESDELRRGTFEVHTHITGDDACEMGSIANLTCRGLQPRG